MRVMNAFQRHKKLDTVTHILLADQEWHEVVTGSLGIDDGSIVSWDSASDEDEGSTLFVHIDDISAVKVVE